MVTLRLVPLLFLAGCAATQSAFPMPAPFEAAAEDAPIFIGQPGMVTPEPEKSPHKRLLPETPESRQEAGVWAGDGRKIGGPLRILDVVVPVPAIDTEEEAGDVDVCEWALSDVLRSNGPLATYLRALTDEQRLCGVMRAWSFCMRVHFGNDARWEASEKIRARVYGPFEERCKHVDTTRFMMHFNDAMRTWLHDRKNVQ